MFKRLTDRLTSAAHAVAAAAASTGPPPENDAVTRLVGLGFDATSARHALRATEGNLEQAAELLLLQQQPQQSQQLPLPAASPPVSAALAHSSDADLARAMEASRWDEEERQWQLAKTRSRDSSSSSSSRPTTNSVAPKKATRPLPSAAAHHAGRAAVARAAGTPSTTRALSSSSSSSLSITHPRVKLLPKLADKSVEEQILRTTDRLKAHPAAVDSLYRALTAVQAQPDADRYRRIDTQSAGYIQSVAPAPGAYDLLRAMQYQPSRDTTAVASSRFLLLERCLVDPALLYLGISALEQTKLTPEYRRAKALQQFQQQVDDLLAVEASAAATADPDNQDVDHAARASFRRQCPTEPAMGRGALVTVTLGPRHTWRRRFDGDDTVNDILAWLGGHVASAVPARLRDGTWTLLDQNQSPAVVMDALRDGSHTLQSLGCWPSGKLAIVPSVIMAIDHERPTETRY